MPGIESDTMDSMIKNDKSSSWDQIAWTRRARKKFTILYLVKLSRPFLKNSTIDFSKAVESCGGRDFIELTPSYN